ncbi:hypothetical protein MASR1M32_41690 [Rhodobacter sp.]
MRPGQRNLITDVPGILVGNAQEPRLRSGVTVLTGPRPRWRPCMSWAEHPAPARPIFWPRIGWWTG